MCPSEWYSLNCVWIEPCISTIIRVKTLPYKRPGVTSGVTTGVPGTPIGVSGRRGSRPGSPLARAFVRGDTAMTAEALKTVDLEPAPGDAGITGLAYTDLAYTVAR